MSKERFNRFSVPLGLFDYVNPILYSITIITIIKNIYYLMDFPYQIILLVGAILSIIAGFIIPTGKVIVGLGLIKFRMPVVLVFSVNFGILLSGLMFLKYVMNFGIGVLFLFVCFICLFLSLIYQKSKKMNTIAVLIGTFGYLSIYTSLITLSFRSGSFYSIMMYLLAILLFVMLCSIGIKANLKDAKIHWVIEISNVLCQALVAIATILLF